MNIDGLEKLVSDLEGLEKPMMSADLKNKMKMRVMDRVASEAGSTVLVKDLSRVSRDVVMDVVSKARVKENVFEKLYRSPGFFGFLQPFKKVMSATLAVVLFFGVFVYLKPSDHFVSAQEISFINSLEGEVWVYRDGERILGKVGFELVPGDELLTAEDAVVEIYFFDDSRSQLAPNSRLVINQLAELANERPGTYVNVSLVDGRVWTKVVDLPEESSFIVEAQGNFVETDKAAFDVEVKNKKVSVGVFNSSVAVKNGGGKVEKLLSGQKLVFNDENGAKELISDEERTVKWVAGNLQIDQKYLSDVEKNLITAKIVAIGEGFSPEKDELVFLDYNDVAKQKTAFLAAEKALASAQYDVSFNGADKAILTAAIAKFEGEVEAFYNLIVQVRYTDTKYADSLKIFVDSKIVAYRNDLAATLPTSQAYELKQAINNLEVKTVVDPVKALELKVSQVQDAISDVDAVKDVADTSTLTKVTNDYVQDVKQVFQDIDTLPTADSEVKQQLKVNLIEDFSMIDSVTKTTDFNLKTTTDGKVLSPLF